MAFARKLGLRAVPVVISDRSQLIPALRAGQGDVIVGSLAITPERAEEIAFTRPVRLVAQQVVVPKADRSLKPAGGPRREDRDGPGLELLRRRRSRGSRPRVKGLEIKPARETEDTFDLIQKVARGEEAITVADSDILAAALTFEPGVKAAFTLSRARLDRLGRPQGESRAQGGARRLPRRAGADRLQGSRGARGPRRHPQARGAPGAHPQLEHDVLPPPRGGARLRVRAGPRVRADARGAPRAGDPPVARGARRVPPGGQGGSGRGGARRDARAPPGVRVHDALQPGERDPRRAGEGPHHPRPRRISAAGRSACGARRATTRRSRRSRPSTGSSWSSCRRTRRPRTSWRRWGTASSPPRWPTRTSSTSSSPTATPSAVRARSASPGRSPGCSGRTSRSSRRPRTGSSGGSIGARSTTSR